jgi:hypothetical protein
MQGAGTTYRSFATSLGCIGNNAMDQLELSKDELEKPLLKTKMSYN